MSKILEGIGNVAKGAAGLAGAVAVVAAAGYVSILEERVNLEKEIVTMEIELNNKKKRLAEIKGA